MGRKSLMGLLRDVFIRTCQSHNLKFWIRAWRILVSEMVWISIIKFKTFSHAEMAVADWCFVCCHHLYFSSKSFFTEACSVWSEETPPSVVDMNRICCTLCLHFSALNQNPFFSVHLFVVLLASNLSACNGLNMWMSSVFLCWNPPISLKVWLFSNSNQIPLSEIKSAFGCSSEPKLLKIFGILTILDCLWWLVSLVFFERKHYLIIMALYQVVICSCLVFKLCTVKHIWLVILQLYTRRNSEGE